MNRWFWWVENFWMYLENWFFRLAETAADRADMAMIRRASVHPRTTGPPDQ